MANTLEPKRQRERVKVLNSHLYTVHNSSVDSRHLTPHILPARELGNLISPLERDINLGKRLVRGATACELGNVRRSEGHSVMEWIRVEISPDTKVSPRLTGSSL